MQNIAYLSLNCVVYVESIMNQYVQRIQIISWFFVYGAWI